MFSLCVGLVSHSPIHTLYLQRVNCVDLLFHFHAVLTVLLFTSWVESYHVTLEAPVM